MSLRPMSEDDVPWAAELMAHRRARYAAYSPVFWRPHRDAVAAHTGFLRAQVTNEECIALRTERGFLIAQPRNDTLFIDDFAVDADDAWARDGQQLLFA